MLNKSKIRKMGNPTSYERGVTIHQSGRVRNFKVEEENEISHITAMVKGSGSNLYGVDINYDTMVDYVEDCYCDCPAFYSYAGICKHCIAVLLEYMNYESSKAPIFDFLESISSLEKHGTASANAEGNVRRFTSGTGNDRTSLKAPQTTPAIKELLSRQMVKKTMPLMQSQTYGKVRIDPYLECNSSYMQAEFKIGTTQMYVMKDVYAFARYMQQNANYSYGKKLEFIHMMEAFDPQSVELVRFILEWTQMNKSRYVQSGYYGYYTQSSARQRMITLDSNSLEALFEAVGDGSITANINNTGEKSWRIVEEKLSHKLELTGKAGGLEIKLEKWSGIAGSKSYFYFQDGLIYKVSMQEINPVLDFVQCASSLSGDKIYIQKEDLPVFCREMLPALEQHFICTRENFLEQDYGVFPVSFELYLDAPQKDFITFRLLAVYGEKKYNVYDGEEDKAFRDIWKEVEIGRIVSSHCNAYDEAEHMMVLSDDEDLIYELLVNGIPKLQQAAEVYVSDAMKRLNVSQAPKVAVGISLSGDLLELNISSGDISREQLLEILSRYNRKKKYYRLKNGEFINMDGESLGALLELKQGLGLTDRQLKKEAITLPKYRALYLDAELKEWQGLPTSKDKAFKALVRNMKTVEDNDFEVPQSLTGILREYQKSGFLWLKTLKNNGFGGILADDMGLGKTLQVIAYLLSEQQEVTGNRRCLIITPASLVFNWCSEMERFAPQLTVRAVAGTAAERRDALKDIGETDILITSYDLLKRDQEYYEDITFACQIIDEAQYIKNHNTQAAQAVKAIKASLKLALTGTPVENRLSELWSIFDYLMPGFLYGYQQFRSELELPIVQNDDKDALTRLQKMIRPFVLRRLKKDVLKDLPDKLEENIYARLEGEQQALYDAHVTRLKLMLDKQSDEEFKTSKIQILSELTKLRQLCCDPSLLYEDYQENSAKADMCMDLLHNAINGGHKVLLFSQFTTMLSHLQMRMAADGITFYTLTGATSKEKRRILVDAFNQDDTSVFCISLKAGGTGLNLTAADIVIHYDPWWNLAVQNQATDRAHRIGQRNVVNVYRLLVKGTIEDNIMKLQEKKRELADQVLSGEGMGSGSFSRDELLELLS